MLILCASSLQRYFNLAQFGHEFVQAVQLRAHIAAPRVAVAIVVGVIGLMINHFVAVRAVVRVIVNLDLFLQFLPSIDPLDLLVPQFLLGLRQSVTEYRLDAYVTPTTSQILNLLRAHLSDPVEQLLGVARLIELRIPLSQRGAHFVSRMTHRQWRTMIFFFLFIALQSRHVKALFFFRRQTNIFAHNYGLSD